MLRYKTKTRPALVTLYDIGPGNGAIYSYNPRARTGRVQRKTTFTATNYTASILWSRQHKSHTNRKTMQSKLHILIMESPEIH